MTRGQEDGDGDDEHAPLVAVAGRPPESVPSPGPGIGDAGLTPPVAYPPLWLAGGCGAHLILGLLPVTSRYLQVAASPPFPPFRLLSFVGLIALSALGAAHAAAAAWRYAMKSTPEFVNESVDESMTGTELLPVPPPHTPTPPATPARPRWRDLTRGQWLLAGGLGANVLGRNALNMLATRFVRARWVQMVTSLTPVLVAGFAWIEGEAMAPRTGAAVGLSLLGVAAAVAGGSESGPSASGITWAEATGLGLAFASAVSLAAYMVLVKRTGAFLSESQIMLLQFVCLVGTCLPASALAESGPWLGLLTGLGVKGWAALLSLSLLVFCAANLLHQLVIRRLGAAASATLMPLRLVSAIGFGWLFLGEVVTSWLEAGGLVVVGGTISWYLAGVRAPVARGLPRAVTDAAGGSVGGETGVGGGGSPCSSPRAVVAAAPLRRIYSYSRP